jgi:hypothetical protein
MVSCTFASFDTSRHSKFRFIFELDIKSGVADWNKCFTATPSALKQQAFTGIYICGYK